MNEIIKEQPDRTAAKMAQFIQDIEDLKAELDHKNKQLDYFDKLQRDFVSVGPMKSQIDKLMKLVQEKDSLLADEKIDKEEYRQKLFALQEEHASALRENEDMHYI